MIRPAPSIQNASTSDYSTQSNLSISHSLKPTSNATSHEASTSPTTQSDLFLKLAGDAAVATGVTFFMSPFASIIDAAITQRASTGQSLMNAGRNTVRSILQNPVSYAKSPAFLCVWTVYASTYTTANWIKTLTEYHQEHSSSDKQITTNNGNTTNSSSSSLSQMSIVLGTLSVNTTTSLWKDRAFAQMYAAKPAMTQAATKMPLASYGFWLSRDLIGIGSSFVLPDMIVEKFSSPDATKEERENLQSWSQFFVPICTQFVAGPFHLLGLDVFNRPMNDMPLRHRLMEHSRCVIDGYSAVVGARIARIIPAYGFGGVFNTKFRNQWREYLVERRENTLTETIGSDRTSRPSTLSSLLQDMQQALAIEI